MKTKAIVAILAVVMMASTFIPAIYGQPTSGDVVESKPTPKINTNYTTNFTSNIDGSLNCDSGVYSKSISGSGNLSVSSGELFGWLCYEQVLYQNYRFFKTYISFDTSSIRNGNIIGDANLYMNLDSFNQIGADATDFSAVVYSVDYGTSLTIADWGESTTLLGEIFNTTEGAGTYNITVNSSYLNPYGYTQFVILTNDTIPPIPNLDDRMEYAFVSTFGLNVSYSSPIIHIPIRINNNTEFNLTNGVTWGNGTSLNPYIISDWVISGGNSTPCIYIGNTTAYFEISNCKLWYSSGYSGISYNTNAGVNLYNVSNGTVNNSMISDCRYGVFAVYCDNNTYKNLNVSNMVVGLFNYLSGYDTIDSCVAYDNSYYGILVNQSDYCNITNNYLFSNTLYGIYNYMANYSCIENNTATGYNDFGIRGYMSEYNLISNNNCTWNRYGIYYRHSNNDTFTYNLVSGGLYGIYMSYCYDMIISHTTAYNNSFGMRIFMTERSIIENNNMSNNIQRGIWILTSNNNTIQNNTVLNNTEIGILLDTSADDCYIINNTISESSHGILVQSSYHATIYDNYIYTTNNFSIYIYYGNDSVVMNNTVFDSIYGIYLRYSDYSIVINNTAYDTTQCIWISYCEFVNVINNTANMSTYGIRFISTDYSTISDNNASDNTDRGIFLLTSDYNIIENNNVYDNIGGVILNICDNCLISNNSIGNNDYGISIVGNDTTIYHNNFYSNVWNTQTGTNNKWNLSYSIGGNYYDNYTGLDIYSGVYQNSIGSDNIGDEPFIPCNGTYDYYPLFIPYPEYNLTACAGDDVTLVIGVPMQFNASLSYSLYGITNYTWNFTYNGTPVHLYGVSPVYTFNMLDNYTITLQITDGINVDYDIIEVMSWGAIAGSDDITYRGNYTFNGSLSVGAITNYTWSFVFNSTLTYVYGITPTFNFTLLGNYTVTLTVKVGMLSDNDTMILSVINQLPIANAGSDDIFYNGNYTFNGSSSSDLDGAIVNYTWNFTFNSMPIMIYEVDAWFNFSISDTYIIMLMVRDNDGGISYDNMTLDANQYPFVDAGATQTGLKGIYYMDGTNSSDPDGVITNLTWNFTYNSLPKYIYGYTPLFDFEILGDYYITLTITDNGGLQSANTTWVNITSSSPIPHIIPISGSLKGIHELDGSASYDLDGSIVNWTWEIRENGGVYDGGGVYGYAYGETPNFDFADELNYNITLTVEDDDGLTNSTKEFFNVTFLTPTADFTITVDNTVRGIKTFNGAISTDVDGVIANYTWEFDYNGSPITLYNVVTTYDFQNDTTYYVNLTVTDDDGLTNTTMHTFEVILYAPTAIISNITDSHVLYQGNLVNTRNITFSALESTDPDGTITNYTWNMTVSYTNQTPFTVWFYTSTFDYTFNSTGNVTFILMVTDDTGLTNITTVSYGVVDRSALDQTFDVLMEVFLPLIFIFIIIWVVYQIYKKISRRKDDDFKL